MYVCFFFVFFCTYVFFCVHSFFLCTQFFCVYIVLCVYIVVYTQKSSNADSMITIRSQSSWSKINTRYAWAGGTFFQLSVFWFWQEIGFGFTYYLCNQSTIQLRCCVSFFGCGGKQFLVLRIHLVYNTVVWQESEFCTNFLVESEFSSRTQEFLKNIEIFYSLIVATVSQKYRELSIQVENCE